MGGGRLRARAGGMRANARGRPDTGSTALEVVLLVPVMTLLALFVLWAGRGGRTALITDLAAEEAATLAALACDNPQSSECEVLVEDLLSARPGLDFLCIGGARPAQVEGVQVEHRIVSGKVVAFDGTGEATGVSVVAVDFICETDGAVAPLAGVFPTVQFRGRASEVAIRIRQGAPRIVIDPVSVTEVTEGGTLEVTEGETLELAVSLDSVTNQELTLKYIVELEDQTAETADFEPESALEGEITIPAEGSRAGETIRIETFDDDVYEGHETLKLILTVKDPPEDGPPRVVLDAEGYVGTIPGTILDNESRPRFQITPSPAEVTEGGTLEFTVRLVNDALELQPIEGIATVVFETVELPASPRHAVAGQDFWPVVSRELTFNNVSSTPVPVETIDDWVPEGDETLRARLSDPTLNGIRIDDTLDSPVEVTILDNEPRLVVRGDCDDEGRDDFVACASEGESLSFTVSLEGSIYDDLLNDDDTVTVDAEVIVPMQLQWQPADPAPPEHTGGCGAPDDDDPLEYDYVPPASQRLEFGGRVTEHTITIETCADGAPEDHYESLELSLLRHSRNVHPPTGGLGLIIDGDDAPTVRIVDAAPVWEIKEIVEKEGGEVFVEQTRLVFPVTLSGPSARTVTVWYRVEDITAIGGVDGDGDYDAVPPGALIFGSGATEKTIEVAVNDDEFDEADERLEVRLTQASGALLPREGDVPCLGLGDPGRSDDDNCGVGIVLDDDPVPIAIIADAAPVREGEIATFAVSLVDEHGEPTTAHRRYAVEYDMPFSAGRTNHEAESNDVRALTPPVLRFEVGESSKSIEVLAVADSVFEDVEETFEVRLLDRYPSGSVRLGRTVAKFFSRGCRPASERPEYETDFCAEGTVLRDEEEEDDDEEDEEAIELPEVSVEPATATEGDELRDDLRFEVTLDKEPTAETGAAVIHFVTEDIDLDMLDEGAERAHQGVDYDRTSSRDPDGPGPVTFEIGDTSSKWVEVPIRDDDERERTEQLWLRLTGATNANLKSAPDQRGAKGTILDDDSCVVGDSNPPQMLPAGNRFVEDDRSYDVTLTVDLPPCTETRLLASTTDSTTDMTATAGEDYEALVDAEVTLSARTGTLRVPVRLLDDTVREGDETFLVTLRWDPRDMPFAWRDERYEAEVTIIDDDINGVAVSDAGPVVEGAPLVFTLELTDAVDHEVKVGYTTEQIVARPGQQLTVPAATRGDDYTHVEGTATFEPRDTAVEVEVETAEDNTWFEDREELRLRLTGVETTLDSEGPDGRSIPNASIEDDVATGTIIGICWDVEGRGGPPPVRIHDAEPVNEGDDSEDARLFKDLARSRFRVDLGARLCDRADDEATFGTSKVPATAVPPGTRSASSRDLTIGSSGGWPPPQSSPGLTSFHEVPIVDDAWVEPTEVFYMCWLWGPEHRDPVTDHRIRTNACNSGADGDVVRIGRAVGTIFDNDRECVEIGDPSGYPVRLILIGHGLREDGEPFISHGDSTVHSPAVGLSQPLCSPVRLRVTIRPSEATDPNQRADIGPRSREGVDLADDLGLELLVDVPAGTNEVSIHEWVGGLIVNDDLYEPVDEEFVVVAQWVRHDEPLPARYARAEPVAGLVRIVDDDAASVSVEDASAGEGDGQIDFTLTVDEASDERLHVRYETRQIPSDHVLFGDTDDRQGEPATRDVDYTHVTDGIATFEPGELTRTVSIPILDDEIPELHDEMFRLVLTEAYHDSSAIPRRMDDRSAVGTIEDDEAPCITAYADQYPDYPPPAPRMLTAVEGPFNGRHISTEAGAASEVEMVLKLGYPLCEPAQIQLGFCETACGFDLGSEVIERAGTNAAELCHDYVPAGWEDTCRGPASLWPETLTIPADERTVEVAVTAVDDVLNEGLEEFFVWVEWLDDDEGDIAAEWDSAPRVGWLVVIGDDDKQPTLSMQGDDVIESRTATVRFDLDRPSGRDVTADYELQGVRRWWYNHDLLTLGGFSDREWYTAATGGTSCDDDTDFVTNPGSISFPSGTTTVFLHIRTCADTRPEGNEAFTVRLHNIQHASLRSGSLSGEGTEVRIIDDDAAPRLSLQTGVSAREGTSATVAAVLERQAGREVGFTYRTVECGTGTYRANSDTDFEAVVASEEVTIPAGEYIAYFDVKTLPDDLSEADETFCVEVADVTFGGEQVAKPGFKNRQAEVRINDDECFSPPSTGLDQRLPRIWSTLIPGGRFDSWHGFLRPGTASDAQIIYEDSGEPLTSHPSWNTVPFWLEIDRPPCEHYDYTVHFFGFSPPTADRPTGLHQAGATRAGSDVKIPEGSANYLYRTWPAGETSQEFAFEVHDDGDPEGPQGRLEIESGIEKFRVVLAWGRRGRPSPGESPGDAYWYYDIGIADGTSNLGGMPRLSLQHDVARAEEGGAATVTARLDRTADRHVHFTYVTVECGDYRATPVTDFPKITTSEAVRIGIGETSTTFAVSTEHDTESEAEETFCVRVADVSFGEEEVESPRFGNRQATVLINDDDCLSAPGVLPGQRLPRLSVNLPEGGFVEGDGDLQIGLWGKRNWRSTTSFTITLANPNEMCADFGTGENVARIWLEVTSGSENGAVVVKPRDDPATAAREADIRVLDYLGRRQAFDPGRRRAVWIQDDDRDEGDETVVFTVWWETRGGEILRSHAWSYETTIINSSCVADDSGPPQASVEDIRSPEKSASYVVTLVTRPLCSGTRLLASTTDTTATAGADYEALDDVVVTLSERSRTLQVPVRLLEDTVPEGDETFLVTLRWHPDDVPDAWEDERYKAVVTIIDDDVPKVGVRPASVVEGGKLRFTVRLWTPTPYEVKVRYTTEQIEAPPSSVTAATPGVDYTHVEDTVTFPVTRVVDGSFVDADRLITVEVQTEGNDAVTGDKQLRLRLIGVESYLDDDGLIPNAVFDFPVATGTITDDD